MPASSVLQSLRAESRQGSNSTTTRSRSSTSSTGSEVINSEVNSEVKCHGCHASLGLRTVIPMESLRGFWSPTPQPSSSSESACSCTLFTRLNSLRVFASLVCVVACPAGIDVSYVSHFFSSNLRFRCSFLPSRPHQPVLSCCSPFQNS